MVGFEDNMNPIRFSQITFIDWYVYMWSEGFKVKNQHLFLRFM